MAKTFRVSLKYPDGTTMFMGTLLAEEIIQIPVAEKQIPVAEKPSTNSGRQTDTGERMTDPQKRYLFRLLGAQGVEGKKAEEHLKSHFEVSRLPDISRQAASEYIDRLVKDKQDAAS